MWRAEDPQGDEAGKVRFEIVPYLGETCLDIGCGPKKVFPHFIGLDSGKDTALFGIEIKPDIVGDCERIPLFADGSFDTVFSSHTLEHIVDYRGALAEWWRLVSVGGHLILYLPHREHYPRIGQAGANPDHKHDFANEDITAAMRELGPDWALVVDDVRSEGREYSFLQIYRKGAAGSGQLYPGHAARPEKRCGLVRLGAYGDALWISSLLPQLKQQGYEITVYTERPGREALACDPHIDRFIVVPHGLLDDVQLVLYLLWESRKYARFLNTLGVVETRLLPHPNEHAYHWPHDARVREMNRNYLEALHDVAGLEHSFAQRFYPSAEENAWAAEERRRLEGPVVVVAPTGSGLPKTWPHVQRFMELMAEARVHTIVLGELRQDFRAPAEYGHVIGTKLPIRLAMTLALFADMVVGTESAIINAVAFEAMPKIVLLSHSTPENLTKHWRNTSTVEPVGLACYPCHRLHRDFTFCARHPDTGFAACQSAAGAEDIARVALEYLAPQLEAAA